MPLILSHLPRAGEVSIFLFKMRVAFLALASATRGRDPVRGGRCRGDGGGRWCERGAIRRRPKSGWCRGRG